MKEADHLPFRVFMVVARDDAATGGALRVAEYLLNAFDPNEVEAELVVAYGEVGPVGSLTTRPVHTLKARSFHDPKAWGRWLKLISERSPALIHFQESVNWMRLTGRSRKVPQLIHIHGRPSVVFGSLLERWASSATIKQADGLACISEDARDRIVELNLADPTRTWVVPNAVDTSRLEDLPSAEDARRSLALPRDKKLLGMVCRLVKQRGCDDAIRVLSHLDTGWALFICGDGPERPRLEQIAISEGVADRVHFTGPLKDVRLAYAAMDLYLTMARYESFGLAIGEAMFCRVPVVGLLGLDQGMESETPLVTSRNSMMFQRSAPERQEDPEPRSTMIALATRIQELVTDEARRMVMVAEAQAWVAEHFDPTARAKEMTRVYLEFLAAMQRK